jgi:hypothetical protein
VLVAFFAPALFTGDQLLFRDNGRMHWPVKHYVAERLRQGQVPQWNPYSGLGIPLVAGAIDAVQHPFNLLLVLLPFELGFKLWALLSYLLAATGGFAWARQLGRSWHASVAAGLAFALSGPLVGSSDNLTYLTTLAALPWLFAAAHGWLDLGGRPRLALLGLASGLCAASGDPQAWGFAVASLPLYAALVAGQATGRRRALLRGLGATGAALVGAAPFILPVLAWMPESSRGDLVDEFLLRRWDMPLPRLLELAVPHLYRDAPGALSSPLYIAYGGGEITPIPWVLSVYVGVSVLALSIIGMIRCRPARWLVLGAALSTWMALGHHAGFGQLLPHLPLLRGFRYWEKMAIWPALLLSMTAAYGFDEVVTRRPRSTRAGVAIVSAAGLTLALVAAGHVFSGGLVRVLQGPSRQPELAQALAGNLRDGLLESGLVCLVLGLAVLAIQRGLVLRGPAPLIALVVIADPFAANVRGYTLADPAIVRPRAPFRDFLKSQPGLQRVFTPFELTRDRWPQLREFEAGWLWAGHMLEASFNVGDGIGNYEAYTGMLPFRLDRFSRRVPAARRLPIIGIYGVGYMPVPSSPDVARAAGLAPPFHVVAVDTELPAFLLRVPHRERAYFASELASVDRRGAMDFVLSVDCSRTERSVVEGPLPEGYVPVHGQARIVTDEPERVVVETTSEGRGLLVLNDTYAAGWAARVDGHPSAILPANYLVRGVWVEGGRHTVEFSYRTPWLREGWALFLAGAAALTATGAAQRHRRTSDRAATQDS